MTERSEPWHLDKRVPIALIVTIFMQTLGAVWWAASLENRMRTVEREVSSLIQADFAQREEVRRLAEYMARLDERVAQIMVVLKEVRDELKKR